MIEKEKKKKRTLDETNNCCRSRGRGYTWEKTLVKRFNAHDYVPLIKEGPWSAMRLGGTTAYIPDVIATYTNTHLKKDIMLGIECKSGTGTVLEVWDDQIDRCRTIGELFRAYRKRFVVLAFKFSKKKRVKKEFEMRMLREYFVVIDPGYYVMRTLKRVRCNYGGRITMVVNQDKESYGQKMEQGFNYWMFDSFDKLMNYMESID